MSKWARPIPYAVWSGFSRSWALTAIWNAWRFLAIFDVSDIARRSAYPLARRRRTSSLDGRRGDAVARAPRAAPRRRSRRARSARRPRRRGPASSSASGAELASSSSIVARVDRRALGAGDAPRSRRPRPRAAARQRGCARTSPIGAPTAAVVQRERREPGELAPQDVGLAVERRFAGISAARRTWANASTSGRRRELDRGTAGRVHDVAGLDAARRRCGSTPATTASPKRSRRRVEVLDPVEQRDDEPGLDAHARRAPRRAPAPSPRRRARRPAVSSTATARRVHGERPEPHALDRAARRGRSPPRSPRARRRSPASPARASAPATKPPTPPGPRTATVTATRDRRPDRA